MRNTRLHKTHFINIQITAWVYLNVKWVLINVRLRYTSLRISQNQAANRLRQTCIVFGSNRFSDGLVYIIDWIEFTETEASRSIFRRLLWVVSESAHFFVSALRVRTVSIHFWRHQFWGGVESNEKRSDYTFFSDSVTLARPESELSYGSLEIRPNWAKPSPAKDDRAIR